MTAYQQALTAILLRNPAALQVVRQSLADNEADIIPASAGPAVSAQIAPSRGRQASFSPTTAAPSARQGRDLPRRGPAVVAAE